MAEGSPCEAEKRKKAGSLSFSDGSPLNYGRVLWTVLKNGTLLFIPSRTR